MKVELSGWSSEGIRCPDVSVDLCNGGAPPPVALIQMPNGTGKTTTLQLLKAALDGEATSWEPDQVRRYRRAGDQRERGRFLVHILVDDERVTFELTLDFENGRASYRTTSPGSGGVVNGWNPPPGVRRFLNPQFVDLFVFDGEFADRLLDRRKAEAEKAIDGLCQLYLLDDVVRIAEQRWEAASQRASAKTETGLKREQNKHSKIRKRLKNLEAARRKAEQENGDLEGRISELESQIQSHIAQLHDTRKEHEAAEEELRAASHELQRGEVEVMRLLRHPDSLDSRIGNSLHSLKANLDRLRLPENTSAQFFKELADEPHCVCGRAIDEQAKTSILERASQYLGEEHSGIINAIKRDIETYLPTGVPPDRPERLRSKILEMKRTSRRLSTAEQKTRALKKRLIEAGDEQLALWQQELDESRKRKEALDAALKELNRKPEDGDDYTTSKCIQFLKRCLKDTKDRISEITGTIQLRQRTTLICGIAREASRMARDRIRSTLLADCNKRIEDILSQDPVRLARIDRSLVLARQEGASVGQTLAVGYTFLMSALQRGQNDFPLVVDSPANPLDRPRRRAIGRLIPELCSQFIAFTISTERTSFVPALEEQTNQIRYFTVFRKTPGTAQLLESLPSSGVTMTRNAVVVQGRAYYHSFDVEAEEDN